MICLVISISTKHSSFIRYNPHRNTLRCRGLIYLNAHTPIYVSPVEFSRVQCNQMHPNLILPFGEGQCNCILSAEAKMMPRYFDAWMSDYSSMKHPLASLKARRFLDAFQWQALVHTYTQHVRPRVVCACLFIRPFYGPLQVLDVAHLHNNATHLKPANNSAALPSIAESWFPNLVQPTHRRPTRSHSYKQKAGVFFSLFNLKSYLLYPADNSSLQKSKFARVVCWPQKL